MSKWNKPMRAYKPASLFCSKCGKPIRVPREECRMVGAEVYHLFCAPAGSWKR